MGKPSIGPPTAGPGVSPCFQYVHHSVVPDWYIWSHWCRSSLPWPSSWQLMPQLCVPAMYRTCGAGCAHQLCVHTVCSTVKCNFTHFQFAFNAGWDKPVNHLPWEEEQYQLIYGANQKHIIFVLFVFTAVLSLKIFWVVFVLNSLPFFFQNLVFQSNLYLSYLFHTNGKKQWFNLLTYV